jgi:hypothetical protein
MIRVHRLLVPLGCLRVEDTWQDIYAEDGSEPVLIGRWLTLRTTYLNGQLLPWSLATRDVLAAVADAIDGGPLPRLWDPIMTEPPALPAGGPPT